MRPDPQRRRPALVLASAAAALIAVLALAGLAIAHGDSRHHDDDDPAGQIASFDPGTGQLVIDLGGGGQIAGTVTKWTWIKAGDRCDDDGGEASRKGDWDCDDGDSGSEDRGYRHRLSGGHDDDDRGPRHRGGGDIDDLVVGAVVEDSLMVLKDGRAFYAKIDLDD